MSGLRYGNTLWAQFAFRIPTYNEGLPIILSSRTAPLFRLLTTSDSKEMTLPATLDPTGPLDDTYAKKKTVEHNLYLT